MWCDIKRRTSNKKNLKYAGRGIRMYREWRESYDAFREYVCSLPNCPAGVLDQVGNGKTLKRSLDRVANDEGYEPGNLRWATAKQQARNRRSTVYVTLKVSLSEACELKGLNYKRMWQLMNRGHSFEDAVNKCTE